ncbi:putative peptidyl-trna hydrolase domain-containing protein [Diaporthe ampelina]|uniref:Putative peptidyl-trna hydrolase domain-containing protein n=1 Tax=Diaporthe ampelina TaxID=1214573 RepID=A0A0G2F9S4_9PEZI|nr:putative peptidyl-trna hydrolase domain-containing protein [Diaporthe ampelina]
MPLPAATQLAPWKRFVRYQAFDASFDPDELAEARKWRQAFSEDTLPKGTTTFARSSGPGGQHVNKSVSTHWRLDPRQTETKAITTWTVSELSQVVPKLMRPLLRSSKNYVKGKDCISFQAQTKRDRNANAEENRAKLLEELHRIYSDAVPGDTSVEKVQKHKALEKSFRESRLKTKKYQSSKKQSRKGGGSE